MEAPGSRAENCGFRWALNGDYFNKSFAEIANIMLPSGVVQRNTSLALLSKIVIALAKSETDSVEMVADGCSTKLQSIVNKANDASSASRPTLENQATVEATPASASAIFQAGVKRKLGAALEPAEKKASLALCT